MSRQDEFAFDEPLGDSGVAEARLGEHQVVALAFAGSIPVSHPSVAEWREVPQARFLSWTRGEQMAYCAARDADSATHTDDEEWRQFYQQRAQDYRIKLHRHDPALPHL